MLGTQGTERARPVPVSTTASTRVVPGRPPRSKVTFHCSPAAATRITVACVTGWAALANTQAK